MQSHYWNKDDVLVRLRRIEGQVRGLQRMVDDEEYCIEILTQIAAASRALKKVAVALLEDYVRHCVDNPTEGGKDMIAEATAAIDRFVKA